MALVNSLHLGDHWEVGTGRNWAELTENIPPEIGTEKTWSFTLMGDSLAVTVCGRYSISCLGLYIYIYFYLEGEEGRRNE